MGLSFKEQVKEDIRTVFHNTEHFADLTNIVYDRKRYKIPAVLDYDGAVDRKRNASDRAEGIHNADLTVYIPQEYFKRRPRKDAKIEIEKEMYTIIKSEIEMGEIILHLEEFTE